MFSVRKIHCLSCLLRCDGPLQVQLVKTLVVQLVVLEQLQQ
jgi:hypothetical protein